MIYKILLICIYIVHLLVCIINYYPCFHLYAVYLQLYTWNNPCFLGIQCCSCSAFTVCSTCNVISPVKYFLYFYISTFHSMCAVSKMAVFFCSSLISCFSGMLLRYCLSDFATVPVAHIITGITFAFTFHMRWISINRSFYFRVFFASFLIKFVSWIWNVYWHTLLLLLLLLSSSSAAAAALCHVRTSINIHYYYYYYYHHHHHHHHLLGI